jgi:anti-sigma factor ChrR (cupin superfamily)
MMMEAATNRQENRQLPGGAVRQEDVQQAAGSKKARAKAPPAAWFFPGGRFSKESGKLVALISMALQACVGLGGRAIGFV